MSNEPTRRYWKSLEERDADPAFLERAADEFPEPLPVSAPANRLRQGYGGPPKLHAEGGSYDLSFGRRGFLKAAGFSLAGAIATGCNRAPLEKAIPFLVKPEDITPGQALWYASTCGGCSAGCGVLVKARDGRPIKIEGNPQHPLSRGGVCAIGQASVLELYDSRRYRGPLRGGRGAAWDEIDRDITARLDTIRTSGGAVRLVTGTITSPTLQTVITRFLAQFKDARHVTYDPLSSSAILDAHLRTHGRRVLPHYRFDRARVIVSVDADFLGTWIAPVEFTRAYRDGRSLEGTPPRCSYHVQFEPRLSVTGAKADARRPMTPGDGGAVLNHLAARIANRAGVPFGGDAQTSTGNGQRETSSTRVARSGQAANVALGDPPVDAAFLDDVAARLWEARGASLVVAGTQDVAAQIVCNFINHVLGNYGETLDVTQPSLQRQGRDADIEALVGELRAGSVAALLVAGVNPAYDLPIAEGFTSLAKKVPLFVSFAGTPDETSALATHVCPDHHVLESWGDSEAVAGTASVIQPALRPLAGTRALLETLAKWSGDSRAAYDIVGEHWKTVMFARQNAIGSAQEFWDHSVHDGVATLAFDAGRLKPARTSAGDRVEPARTFLAETVTPAPVPSAAPAGALALVLYPKIALLDGRHAHNPWLQELPDPISKVTWDNYASLSPSTAARLNLHEGDVVSLVVSGNRPASLELPVYVQPGQHDGVVAVALGYGRAGTERFRNIGPQWLEARPGVGSNGLVGVNVSPLLTLAGGTLRYDTATATVTPTGARIELAVTQRHHSIAEPQQVSTAGAREIVREMTVADLGRGAAAPRKHEPAEDLWPDDHPYKGHRWGMVVDLNACTGCSGCVIACQAENNIPVVGRDEVRRQREMHWMRIDRYFTDSADGVDVVYEPMMCQHCANASCEGVCPVLATVHSEEGLNQQVYNRCVGTRYCANNCPYKVRRFNWFAYARADERENLVLNPDVTVRSRGVMEKCSLCVQRIEAARIEARQQGTAIAEGDVHTACEQSCPAQAIVFGDLNDPKSRVAQLAQDGRHFHVLEELNERPNVGYLAVVRNRPAEGGNEHV